MKVLYFDLGMGAAGDMLSAALLELFPEEERAAIIDKLNSLGIPDVKYIAEPSVKCGITGTHMTVTVKGVEESEDMHDHHHDGEHDHEHHHDAEHEHHHHDEHTHEHGHGHSHSYNNMAGIEHIVRDHMQLEDNVRADILKIYSLIADAESRVHGMPVSEIHFHEVGTMDAVADVTAAAYLISLIKPDRIIASPVNTGGGTVKCAHGIMPVPAPATACLLEGIPSYDSGIRSELLTPTGAAIIKYYADSFDARPCMSIIASGYGMGKKDFETANCVRAILGEIQTQSVNVSPAADQQGDVVTELAANIDDMSAEELGFAITELMNAGALDAWIEAAVMKKNRPGSILRVLCTEDDKASMVRKIFALTSTIGIRENVMRRYTLCREMVERKTEYGIVRIKRVSGYGIEREKYEYEDLARIAREQGVSIAKARELAAHA